MVVSSEQESPVPESLMGITKLHPLQSLANARREVMGPASLVVIPDRVSKRDTAGSPCGTGSRCAQ
jgi:hypothetical protein